MYPELSPNTPVRFRPYPGWRYPSRLSVGALGTILAFVDCVGDQRVYLVRFAAVTCFLYDSECEPSD